VPDGQNHLQHISEKRYGPVLATRRTAGAQNRRPVPLRAPRPGVYPIFSLSWLGACSHCLKPRPCILKARWLRSKADGATFHHIDGSNPLSTSETADRRPKIVWIAGLFYLLAREAIGRVLCLWLWPCHILSCLFDLKSSWCRTKS
jgi:hypothetical protein